MTEKPAVTGETRVGPTVFAWGTRTFVMGIINVTPDSFSGDGLLADADDGAAAAAARVEGRATQTESTEAAAGQARSMVEAGADLLDIGGESTRPGHDLVDESEELRRVLPVIRAVRAALPGTPLSVDTTKPGVAAAALDAGADAINDVWGVRSDDAMARVAAGRGVPIILMHNRSEPVYEDVVREVIADLRVALDRAVAAGVERRNVLVDPGIGFGKTAEQNLEVLRRLGELRVLGRPIVLGTSRKSTLGKVLGGMAPDQRVEATVATTALGVAAGIDVVRVHDVGANLRGARIADAIVRGGWREEGS